VNSAPQPLEKLERTIAARAASPNEKSYTSQLLAGGVEKIGAKVVEEAAEVVEAAGEPGKSGNEHFIREVGDLVYHLLVLMQHKKSTLADLEAELARRFGVSGLQEKEGRTKKAMVAKPATSKATSTKVAKTTTARKKTASIKVAKRKS
jgi:phosphoribosyl-ATP pyrophosphohydrolase